MKAAVPAAIWATATATASHTMCKLFRCVCVHICIYVSLFCMYSIWCANVLPVLMNTGTHTHRKCNQNSIQLHDINNNYKVKQPYTFLSIICWFEYWASPFDICEF